jgi:tetratricopeptide (TPR) repeat protein
MTAPVRTPWIPLLVLAALGALVAFLWSGTVASRPVMIDAMGAEASFAAGARNLDSPRPTEPPMSVNAPAYPHLLAALGDVRASFAGARRVQWILLAALLPLLAGLAGARHFGATAGIVAAALVLLLGGFWLATSAITPHAWQAAFALVVLLLAPPLGRPRAGSLLPAALAMGFVLAAARAFGAAWAPALAVVLAILMLARREYTAGIGLAAVFGLSLLLVGALRLDPVGGPLPLLGGGGPDARLGWHDGATGVDPRRGETGAWRWVSIRDFGMEAERELGRAVSMPELSRHAYGQAAGWIAGHPLQAGLLALRKAWLVLSGVELAAPDSAVFRARQVAPWAAWLLPVSILVMALGLAGAAGAAGVRNQSATIDGLTVLKALLLATVLAALGGVVRTGDRFALLVAMTGAAGWTLAHVGRLSRATLALGVAALLLGAAAWYVDGRRLESPAEDHFQMGTMLERQRRTAEAGAEYDQALAADPNHLAARIVRAGRLAADGLYDGAISEAESVVASNPKLPSVWLMLARLYQSQNRLVEAQSAYERALELAPRDVEAWNNLGTIHAALGHYEPAIAALKKALAIDPNYRNAFVNLTELEKRGPEGLAASTPTLSQPAAGAQSIAEGVGLVMQRIQANDVAGAQAILAGLREQFGASPDIDLAAGTLALHTGRLDEAVTLLERARSSTTLAAAAWFNLGTAQARRGDIPKAREAFEAVLRLDPTNEPARAALAALPAAGPN